MLLSLSFILFPSLHLELAILGTFATVSLSISGLNIFGTILLLMLWIINFWWLFYFFIDVLNRNHSCRFIKLFIIAWRKSKLLRQIFFTLRNKVGFVFNSFDTFRLAMVSSWLVPLCPAWVCTTCFACFLREQAPYPTNWANTIFTHFDCRHILWSVLVCFFVVKSQLQPLISLVTTRLLGNIHEFDCHVLVNGWVLTRVALASWTRHRSLVHALLVIKLSYMFKVGIWLLITTLGQTAQPLVFTGQPAFYLLII